MAPDPGFQRARRPEQVAERRATILRTARELLGERRLSAISLRDLSSRVGLAKSNVLNYFDSREAIYLELLDADWRDWLDELEQTVPAGDASEPHAAETATAGTLARTLAARPVLCELLSALAGVLEHNVSEDTARRFKTNAAANAVRLREWLRVRLPALDAETAHHCAGAITLLAGALWDYERPTPLVHRLNQEFGGLPARSFEENFATGLRTHLVGATTLGR
ncbi:MAG: TetR family transcriptional regulator [Nocardioides sp.]|uniref:TetR/AcrR family transcriptional regulator n=1 Tax=Nocardioides sp. TaxID=35761 RepID=UPI0039E4F3E8